MGVKQLQLRQSSFTTPYALTQCETRYRRGPRYRSRRPLPSPSSGHRTADITACTVRSGGGGRNPGGAAASPLCPAAFAASSFAAGSMAWSAAQAARAAAAAPAAWEVGTGGAEGSGWDGMRESGRGMQRCAKALWNSVMLTVSICDATAASPWTWRAKAGAVRRG